jgi:hypothetical protein
VVAPGAGETRTDPDGRFVLSGLTAGSYRLLVEAAGFPSVETGDVTAPAAELVVHLTGTVHAVAGRVRRGEAAVSRAEVELAAETGGPVHRTMTNADGAFAFGGLGVGRYLLGARHDGDAAAPTAAVVGEAAGEEPVALSLAPGARCAGRVVDDTGTPLPGLRVRIERSALALGEDPLPALVDSDRDGRFLAGPLPPGSYRIVTAAAGTIQRSIPIVTLDAAAAPPAVTVELVRGARLAGRVVDPHGGAAAGAEIRCVATGIDDLSVQTGPLPPAAEAAALPPGAGRALGAIRFARADREGRFAIPDLIPGRYHLDIAQAGAEPLRSDDLVVGPGERRDLGTMALRAGIEVAGRVADEAGIPIEGARVSVDPTGLPDGAAGRTALTDGGGRFTVALRTGSYRIAARAPGRGVAQSIVEVGTAAPAPIELRLVRAEARLEGMVRDSGGRPLARARLVVHAGDAAATTGGAVTDVGGHFTVQQLPAGDVQVEITHPDYPPTTVGAATGTFAMLTVPFPGAVAGEVRARVTGAAIARGHVEAVGPDGAASRAELRRTGSFRLTRLRPGRWRLTVTAPGYRATEQEIDVPPSVNLGEASVSDLRLEVEPG